MSVYYSRECGPEGLVLVGDGTPPGEALSQVLAQGPVGIRAALELVSYLADILTIAEEDQVTHGDLKPGFVFLEESGTVHIGGYGETRRGGRAPEGRTGKVCSDIYGLGLVLLSLLTTDSLGAIPRNPDEHDALIVEKLREIDWQELADRRWQEPFLQFLGSMLSHDPAERPEALDVANVLGHTSQQLEGESLAEWAANQLEPPTERHHYDQTSRDEGLAEAISIGSGDGLKPHLLPSRQAASSKGESTAIWNREKIFEMLQELDGEDEAPRYSPPEDSAPFQRINQSLPPEIPALPDATMSAGSGPAPHIEETEEPVQRVPPPSTVPRGLKGSPPDGPPGVTGSVPSSAAAVPPPAVSRTVRHPQGSGSEMAESLNVTSSKRKQQVTIVLGIGIFLILNMGVLTGVFLADYFDNDRSRSRDRDDDEDRDLDEEIGFIDGLEDTMGEVLDEREQETEGSDSKEVIEEKTDKKRDRDDRRKESERRDSRKDRDSRESRDSRKDRESSESEEPVPETDSSAFTARVHLGFPGTTAAYFCTPGGETGEFNSSVVFQLSPQTHHFDTAVTTCLIQAGDDYKRNRKGEFKGSFTIQGLGEKNISCRMNGGNISCRGS